MAVGRGRVWWGVIVKKKADMMFAYVLSYQWWLSTEWTVARNGGWGERREDVDAVMVAGSDIYKWKLLFKKLVWCSTTILFKKEVMVTSW